MSGPELAAVDGLRVRVGARVLVDGVSLRVLPGRVTALVGPSGSGKTTTALALLGAYPEGARVSGTVSLAGAGGAPIGHVPQHPGTVLNPARRVGVLLRDLARVHGGGPEAVRRALRDAELSEVDGLLRRYPHQLSGGQQQRLVLAQALLTGARVIVADEPTTGQDPATAHRLAALFRRLAARGTGLLLLSHDLALVRESADEVVLLADGRAVRTGPPDEVLCAPARPELPPVRPALRVRPVMVPTQAAPVRLDVTGLTARHPGGAVVLREVGLSLRAGSAWPSPVARAAARPPSAAAWRGCTRATRARSCWTASRCRAASGGVDGSGWRPCSTSSRTPGRRSRTTARCSTRSPGRRCGCAAAPRRRPRRRPPPCSPSSASIRPRPPARPAVSPAASFNGQRWQGR